MENKMNAMPIPPKQTLYKTAYSFLFRCCVSVSALGKNCAGEWLYECFNESEGIVPFIASERELTNFVI